MHPTSRKLYNSQSDIWDAHEPVEGEFTLLPVGVPPLIMTSQEILLGTGGRYSSTQIWNPDPLGIGPLGTLVSGDDFFPFYDSGEFWYTRQIKSMVLNGLLFDSANLLHRFAMTFPHVTNGGFYRINLSASSALAAEFAAIRTLGSGQTLAITAITIDAP